jgi:hypothetical protein
MFFLAMEFGRSMSGFDLQSALTATTLLSFIVLPYFMPRVDRPEFSVWLLGRTAVSLVAMALGFLFSTTVGTTLPQTFAYLPMTLLLMTAMTSIFLQFYGFLALNTARK